MLLKPITLVAGKGGVGKTTVAAALAVREARAGHRTLVVSTDPAHSLGDVLRRSLGHRPASVESGLDAIEVDAEALARDHVEGVGRALREYAHPDIWPEIDRQMALAREAPGTVEAALIDYLAETLDRLGNDYDRIVLDTAPGGHTLRLLRMPASLGRWATGLAEAHQRHEGLSETLGHTASTQARDRRIAERLQRRHERLDRLRSVLTDRERTAAVVVATPERLPVRETSRLIDDLRATGIAVDNLIVNGLFPEDESEFVCRRRQHQQRWLNELRGRADDLRVQTLDLQAEPPIGSDRLAGLGFDGA